MMSKIKKIRKHSWNINFLSIVLFSFARNKSIRLANGNLRRKRISFVKCAFLEF